MNFGELLPELIKGLSNFTLGNALMISISLVLIYLAIAKEIEPVLLLPIGFGCLLANIPLPSRVNNLVCEIMLACAAPLDLHKVGR